MNTLAVMQRPELLELLALLKQRWLSRQQCAQVRVAVGVHTDVAQPRQCRRAAVAGEGDRGAGEKQGVAAPV